MGNAAGYRRGRVIPWYAWLAICAAIVGLLCYVFWLYLRETIGHR